MNKEINDFLSQEAIETIKEFPFKHKLEERGADFYVSDMIVTLSGLVSTTRKIELKGYFTINEANLICDTMNCILIMNNYTIKSQVINTILDAIDYRELDKKWDVDGHVLYGKLCELNEFQMYCVTCMTNEFWRQACNKSVEEIFLIE